MSDVEDLRRQVAELTEALALARGAGGAAPDPASGAEQVFRRIVETTAEGIVTADASMRTTFANERFARLLG